MILSYDMILENLPRTSRQTDKHTNRQTDREFNYRGHSYPLWIVGGSGPIIYMDIYGYWRFVPHVGNNLTDFTILKSKLANRIDIYNLYTLQLLQK